MDHDNARERLERAVFAQTQSNASIRPATLRENVAEDLACARANVARLEELSQLLEQNPHTSRILELMSNGR